MLDDEMIVGIFYELQMLVGVELQSYGEREGGWRGWVYGLIVVVSVWDKLVKLFCNVLSDVKGIGSLVEVVIEWQ